MLPNSEGELFRATSSTSPSKVRRSTIRLPECREDKLILFTIPLRGKSRKFRPRCRQFHRSRRRAIQHSSADPRCLRPPGDTSCWSQTFSPMQVGHSSCKINTGFHFPSHTICIRYHYWLFSGLRLCYDKVECSGATFTITGVKASGKVLKYQQSKVRNEAPPI